MSKSKIIIIVGPTATGKSKLAVKLCHDFNGSVINADSVQVYKHLNIGTAKPDAEEMDGVPHYLLDSLSPCEPFCAADFRKAAISAIDEITRNGRNVFIVGGTGLYLRVLMGGMIDAPDADPAIQEELGIRASKEGGYALYEELQTVDPQTAQNIDPNDRFRIIRALGFYLSTGEPISKARREHAFGEKDFNALKIGLRMDRARLYKRIEARVERMIAEGLEAEARGLLKMGYTREQKPLTSIGYKQMLMYIDGEMSLNEAVGLIKRDTKRYAKRQFTWFNREDDIDWFDSERVFDGAEYEKVKALVNTFFAADLR